jgi:hypothetical protein
LPHGLAPAWVPGEVSASSIWLPPHPGIRSAADIYTGGSDAETTIVCANIQAALVLSVIFAARLTFTQSQAPRAAAAVPAAVTAARATAKNLLADALKKRCWRTKTSWPGSRVPVTDGCEH